MDQVFAELDSVVAPQTVLGYLNFSDGRTDIRWQKQLHDAHVFLASRGLPRPWELLQQWLHSRLRTLQANQTAAFRDITQARKVLDLFAQVLSAYRLFHTDLFAHLTDADLFQPLFLVRVFEAVLAQLAHSEIGPGTVGETLGRLNDYVGYRPVAVLETRPRGEAYPHERFRPVPIYLRGVGAASGRYHEVLTLALQILGNTNPALLQAAHLDLNLLDEFALDVRAYDHGHPANRRPNHVFGEWDPHHIDGKGRYRRYVARQVTVDALLSRVEQPGERPREEVLLEAAAVLAGTVLMATGISGWGPGAHDSSQTLAVLMPVIARYRDEFYQQLLARTHGGHGQRLRQEESVTRQPFGAARQHLNGFLARHRAAQLQQRFLALLFAEMGYAEASRNEARRIPTPSVRFLSEILSRITTGNREVDRGRLSEAARLLPEIEDLLRRGIACGALADPWNVLGFQGLFPLSPAQEDSLRDPRVDELIQVLEQTFHLYSRASCEAAAAGEKALVEQLLVGMRNLATWWDQYATTEVSDVRRVHGSEAVDSASQVTEVLSRWRERGEASADPAFWRPHVESMQSAKSFALVADALLRKSDMRAAMTLLVNWVGHTEEMALEEGPYSFHHLALRWLLGLISPGKLDTEPSPNPSVEVTLIQKFFDYLEANAEDYWQVPSLELASEASKSAREDLFEAAYEGITYQDSTGSEEGSVIGSGPREGFDLEQDADRLERHLRFLATVARLWVIGARALGSESLTSHEVRLTVENWLSSATSNLKQLLLLADTIHAHPVPGGESSYDSILEFDRRRVIKEQLLYALIGTALDATLAVGALTGVLLPEEESSAESGIHLPESFPEWGPQAVRLERALFRNDVTVARTALLRFVEPFRREPLLFSPLSDNGEPRTILRVRVAQAILRVLLLNLPRLGLLRETYDLLRTARAMEQNQASPGRKVSEFGQYFQTGFTETVEAVVQSVVSDTSQLEDGRLVTLLERLTAPFLALWVEYSRGVQLSSVEGFGEETEWATLRRFIEQYGSDLFHARFMTLANLRGVLHRGVGAYLDYLHQESDPLHPIKLMEDLDRTIPRTEAIRRLEFVLRAIVENYEEYKDYNATTSQSDYGENLHVLLDFLRLKVAYERHAWEFRPLVLVHEVLARRGRRGAAVLWERSFTQLTDGLAQQYLEKVGLLERARGIRLNTIADRLNERFVKPLALDRLRALIEPSIQESRAGGATPAFVRLQEELRAYTLTPTGVGLDVPAWLRTLEAEVHRVQASQSTLVTLAESLYRAPRRLLSLDEIHSQLDDWEQRKALP